MSALSPRTLGELLHAGYGIHAYCSNAYRCWHDAALRLEMLVQRLGWDFQPVAQREELLNRLTCSRCLTRRPQLINLTPNGYSKSPATIPLIRQPEGVSFEEALEHMRALNAQIASHQRPADLWQGKRRYRRFGPRQR